jgi:hypothetical protein
MMSPAAWYQARIAKARVTPPPAFVVSGWLATGEDDCTVQPHGKQAAIRQKAHGTLPKSRQGPLATIAVGRAPPPCVALTLQRVLAESDTRLRHSIGAIRRGPSSQAEAAGSQAAEQHGVRVELSFRLRCPADTRAKIAAGGHPGEGHS